MGIQPYNKNTHINEIKDKHFFHNYTCICKLGMRRSKESVAYFMSLSSVVLYFSSSSIYDHKVIVIIVNITYFFSHSKYQRKVFGCAGQLQDWLGYRLSGLPNQEHC